MGTKATIAKLAAVAFGVWALFGAKKGEAAPAPFPPPPAPVLPVKTATVAIDGLSYKVEFTAFNLGGVMQAIVTLPSSNRVSYGANWAGFTPDQILANAIAQNELPAMAVALAASAKMPAPLPPPPAPPAPVMPPPSPMPMALAQQLAPIINLVQRVWVFRNDVWLGWDAQVPAEINTLTTGILPGEQVSIKLTADASLSILGQTFFSVSGWIELVWPSTIVTVSAPAPSPTLTLPTGICAWMLFYNDWAEAVSAAAAYGITPAQLMTDLCNSSYPGGWTKQAGEPW